jgi:hypothetical protein
MEIPEMYCEVASYLTNRISASTVQFRAGSSIRGSGGTLHPAAQIISHPLFDINTADFDVAVVRVSDIIYANLTIKKKERKENHYKPGLNTLNETGNLVYNLKALQLTAASTLRNATNCD